MKYLDEYRDAEGAARLLGAIGRAVTRPWAIMEVCGGQTHAILRYGIDQLLPEGVELIHGPGCPVCVTSAAIIDRAVALAEEGGVTLCSFGDMLRVPGTGSDLLSARARGADVRVVYSPLDAVALAVAEPGRQVVFFGVGFETTAPAVAMAVLQAERLGLANFSVLTAHVLVPPALEAILADPDRRIHGFLAAGHVCAVMGTHPYHAIAARYRVPIVVTGFEPMDILDGVRLCVDQLEAGRHVVENAYTRAVGADGNVLAQRALEAVFEVVDRDWRGLGEIPSSGLALRPKLARFDAEARFGPVVPVVTETECIAGLVLRGVARPTDCPAFGTRCTPEHPLGAPMVSSEGACAAYQRYRPRGPS